MLLCWETIRSSRSGVTPTRTPCSGIPRAGAGRFRSIGFRREIVDSKKRIEDAYRDRGPWGSVRLSVPWTPSSASPKPWRSSTKPRYRYVSSLAWGPDWSLPALLHDPFTYAEQGYPDLWEIPPCGWHENLLKGNNKCGPVRVGLFPPAMPEAFPSDYVQTPREEFEVNNKSFIDKALRDSAPLVSLIWHPWSLGRFRPGDGRCWRSRSLMCANAE